MFKILGPKPGNEIKVNSSSSMKQCHADDVIKYNKPSVESEDKTNTISYFKTMNVDDVRKLIKNANTVYLMKNIPHILSTLPHVEVL